ncbi:hypothetical protein MP228_011807 [Amoeboaphelidium protococcarum]|nr:hypothetical protein MP228_011807 [Amoeboaphelidium protococcarum]
MLLSASSLYPLAAFALIQTINAQSPGPSPPISSPPATWGQTAQQQRDEENKGLFNAPPSSFFPNLVNQPAVKALPPILPTPPRAPSPGQIAQWERDDENTKLMKEMDSWSAPARAPSTKPLAVKPTAQQGSKPSKNPAVATTAKKTASSTSSKPAVKKPTTPKPKGAKAPAAV